VKGITLVDRGVPVVDHSFARECRVLVNHSGLSEELDAYQLPIIHVLHGRPYGSFLLEQSGEIRIYSYLRTVQRDPRFKLFVTFWREFVPYWAALLPRDKIRCVPAPVDLERWKPGPDGYDFHGHKGEINVTCCDMWRRDKTPFHVINAFFLFASRVTGAKLHVYGAPQKGTGWGILKSLLAEKGLLGEAPVGIVKGLQNVYRAVDCAITPHGIATRSVREPLACGCNLVAASGRYTPFHADPEDLGAYAAQIGRAVFEKADNRKTARLFFDARDTAKEFIALLNEVANGSL
jgi:glycosyltransferase involved in cell wall biosynthesis